MEVIHKNRIHFAAFKCILNKRYVHNLGNLAAQLSDADNDCPQRQYHIDKLYEELVPQLEFVDSELIRTHFLNFNR